MLCSSESVLDPEPDVLETFRVGILIKGGFFTRRGDQMVHQHGEQRVGILL